MNAAGRLSTTFDADTCERIFHAALAAGDIKGVEAALTLMAPQDPHRAQHLMDALRMGLVVREAAEPGGQL